MAVFSKDKTDRFPSAGWTRRQRWTNLCIKKFYESREMNFIYWVMTLNVKNDLQVNPGGTWMGRVELKRYNTALDERKQNGFF